MFLLSKEWLCFQVFFTDELLQEIREIRISERKIYQKITDIYSTSLDYNSVSPLTRDFFKRFKIKCIMLFMEMLQKKLL